MITKELITVNVEGEYVRMLKTYCRVHGINLSRCVNDILKKEYDKLQLQMANLEQFKKINEEYEG